MLKEIKYFIFFITISLFIFYSNNEDSSNKKKYKFWELLKRNEN